MLAVYLFIFPIRIPCWQARQSYFLYWILLFFWDELSIFCKSHTFYRHFLATSIKQSLALLCILIDYPFGFSNFNQVFFKTPLISYVIIYSSLWVFCFPALANYYSPFFYYPEYFTYCCYQFAYELAMALKWVNQFLYFQYYFNFWLNCFRQLIFVNDWLKSKFNQTFNYCFSFTYSLLLFQ